MGRNVRPIFNADAGDDHDECDYDQQRTGPSRRIVIAWIDRVMGNLI